MNSRDFPQRTLVNESTGVHGIALDPLQGYACCYVFSTKHNNFFQWVVEFFTLF